jgi:hypothetical protein
MNQKAYRIGVTILAITLGFFLVLLLTIIGKESSGPIEDTLSTLSSGVSTIENKFILNNRKHARSKSLKWFDSYRKSKKKISDTDRLLFGAYDNEISESFQSIVELEDTLHTTFPIIHLYSAWGSKQNQKFPALQVNAIWDIGSIAMITWEPWLSDFNSEDFPQIDSDPQKRDKNGLLSIAKGDYDKYIDEWINEVKDYEKLIFVRLAHEMNDPYRYPWGPQNNKPEEFISAWKYIVNRFQTAGAANVLWVWSPHPAYGNFDIYYPGNDYVDWIGVGTLNYGTVASWSQWWMFDEILEKGYSELSKYDRPIIITEFGSLGVGGNRANWFENALLLLPAKYPAVKSVIFFHSSQDNTTTYKSLSWYIKDDSASVKSIRKIIGIY